MVPFIVIGLAVVILLLGTLAAGRGQEQPTTGTDYFILTLFVITWIAYWIAVGWVLS